MKAVESESDEQAARFDAPTNEIDSNKDLLLIVGWYWRQDESKGVRVEYPEIFSYVILDAGELAEERDRRVANLGGKVSRDGTVLVPSTKQPGKMVPDPGNYGKLWRIIEANRRTSMDLSDTSKQLVEFLREIDVKSPRKRFKPRK
jgi:hypothetical protein